MRRPPRLKLRCRVRATAHAQGAGLCPRKKCKRARCCEQTVSVRKRANSWEVRLLANDPLLVPFAREGPFFGCHPHPPFEGNGIVTQSPHEREGIVCFRRLVTNMQLLSYIRGSSPCSLELVNPRGLLHSLESTIHL